MCGKFPAPANEATPRLFRIRASVFYRIPPQQASRSLQHLHCSFSRRPFCRFCNEGCGIITQETASTNIISYITQNTAHKRQNPAGQICQANDGWKISTSLQSSRVEKLELSRQTFIQSTYIRPVSQLLHNMTEQNLQLGNREHMAFVWSIIIYRPCAAYLVPASYW